MKKRKRVPMTFRYRDCDAFAAYLREQALQGWHFREWRFGLVFEQGEPEDVFYAVEVFPKGSEMDTRPEDDTEEYAEYCEAAGWKLVDANRKFCIFRRLRADAVPIVAPDERFLNIKKAEWSAWINHACGVILIAVLYWVQMITLNFERWIFNDMLLAVLAAITFCAVREIITLVSIPVWAHKKGRQLETEELWKVFLGQKDIFV